MKSFIQHVVDVQTLASVLELGGPGNHLDADVINLLIEAIRAERDHIMLPKRSVDSLQACGRGCLDARLTEKLGCWRRRPGVNGDNLGLQIQSWIARLWAASSDSSYKKRKGFQIRHFQIRVGQWDGGRGSGRHQDRLFDD